MSLLLLLGIVLFTVGLFVWGGIWFPPSPALMALIFVYPVWGWRRLEALSGSVEHEMTAFHETHQAAAPRFARSDRIASQVDDVRAAMQHSRDVSKGAQDREEALQMLSHDMRAPQASIITLLETEGRGLAPALTARLTGYARRTLALADNFVQLARVNETPFAPEEVNLCDVLNEAIDELYPLYSARKIHVCASGVEEPHYIMAEPGLIIRVILNLLDNAIKYSPEGSSIQCALLYDSQNVRCIITDQGVGMSTDQVAGLFARFSKIGDKRSAGSSGAGLGLTLVKSVMERHGGSVDCRSERGKGSSFTLRFPAAD
jgi:signal transduction histidine kinase